MPRKRGAPFGNKNRLKHGYYSAAAKQRRAQHRAIMRWCRAIPEGARAILKDEFDPDSAPAILPERGGCDDGQES